MAAVARVGAIAGPPASTAAGSGSLLGCSDGGKKIPPTGPDGPGAIDSPTDPPGDALLSAEGWTEAPAGGTAVAPGCEDGPVGAALGRGVGRVVGRGVGAVVAPGVGVAVGGLLG